MQASLGGDNLLVTVVPCVFRLLEGVLIALDAGLQLGLLAGQGSDLLGELAHLLGQLGLGGGKGGLGGSEAGQLRLFALQLGRQRGSVLPAGGNLGLQGRYFRFQPGNIGGVAAAAHALQLPLRPVQIILRPVQVPLRVVQIVFRVGEIGLGVVDIVVRFVQGVQRVGVALLGGLQGGTRPPQGGVLVKQGGVFPCVQALLVAFICSNRVGIAVIGVGHCALRAEDAAVHSVLQTRLELLVAVLGGGDGGGAGAAGDAEAGLLGVNLVLDVLVVQLSQELPLLHIVPHLHRNLLHRISGGGIDQHTACALHGAGGADGALHILPAKHGGVGQGQGSGGGLFPFQQVERHQQQYRRRQEQGAFFQGAAEAFGGALLVSGTGFLFQ